MTSFPFLEIAREFGVDYREVMNPKLPFGPNDDALQRAICAAIIAEGRRCIQVNKQGE